MIDTSLNLRMGPYLGGVMIGAFGFGLIWSLTAAIRTGHRRALTIAAGVIAVLIAPIIGVLVGDPVRTGFLAIASFQYDTKVKAAVDTNGSNPTQLILSDENIGVGGFGTSEAVVYDSSDAIRIGSKGKLVGFAPASKLRALHPEARTISVTLLRDHYYRIVKNNMANISDVDMNDKP